MYSEITNQAKTALCDLLEQADLKAGSLLVIGCSSSEIMGEKIGKGSSLDAAKAVFEGVYPLLCQKGIHLAVQCCEHLNRSLIIERAVAEKRGYEIVNVVPQLHAGGSFAVTAYERFEDAVAVESVCADAGIDIGFTLIGMHLKKVAVPARLEHNRIGEATVLAARTRPRFIGGSRAVYNEELL